MLGSSLALLLAVLFVLPAHADEVTPEFLEQPGRVWVSADLPLAVRAGVIVPLIPYVRFDDGQMETGFLSRLGFIHESTCADMMSCDSISTMAAYRRGAYALDGSALTSAAQPLDQWVFDRPSPETDMAIAGSGFLPSGRTLVAREGDRLVQTRPEGSRIYDALHEDEVWDAQSLAVVFEVSLVQTYDCTSDRLRAHRAIPVADHSPEDAAFAAFLRVTRWQSALDMEARILRTHRIDFSPEELGPAEAARLRQIETLLMLSGFTLTRLAADLANGGTGEISEKARADIAVFSDTMANGAPDPDALRAALNDRAGDFEAAAPIMARFISAMERGEDGYAAAICNRQ